MRHFILLSGTILLAAIAVRQASSTQGPPNPFVKPATFIGKKGGHNFRGIGPTSSKHRTRSSYEGEFHENANAASIGATHGRKEKGGIVGAQNGAAVGNFDDKHNVRANGWGSPGYEERAIKTVFPRRPRKRLTDRDIEDMWKLKEEFNGGTAGSEFGNVVMTNSQDGNDQKQTFRGFGKKDLGRKIPLAGKTGNFDTILKDCAKSRNPKECETIRAHNAQNDFLVNPNNDDITGGTIDSEPEGKSKRTFEYVVSCTGNCESLDSRRAKTTADLSEVGGQRGKQFSWICEGETPGVSKCKDKKSNKVTHTVRVDEDGHTEIISPNRVRVATGECDFAKAKLRQNPVFVCNVKTVAGAGVRATNVKYNSGTVCYKQSDTNKDIKLRDETFDPMEETMPNGETKFKFPGCFKISATVEFINYSDDEMKDLGRRLAGQFHVSVLPIGKLECRDEGTCSLNTPDKACYYCDLCTKGARKGGVGEHSSTTACEEMRGDRVQTLSAIVCPPAETATQNACANFNKLGDYGIKRGDIDVRLEIYEQHRSSKAQYRTAREELNDEYVKKATAQGLGSITWIAEKAALWSQELANAQKLAAKAVSGNAQQLLAQKEDQIYRKIYVNNKLKEKFGAKGPQGKLIHCVSYKQKYGADGDKIDTSVLLEAGTIALNAKDWRKYLEGAKCPKMDAHERKKYKSDEQRLTASSGGGGRGRGRGGILGGIGNLFGGGRR